MKKGVLFDFDGTLMDTQIHYDVAASRTLCKIDAKYTAPYCINYFNGRGWKEVFGELELLEPKHDIPSAFIEALQVARDLGYEGARATKNAISVLKFLEEKNIKKVICSNSSLESIKCNLVKGGLTGFFKDEEIFTHESVENGKPAPDIYLKAMEYLGLTSDECLIIEDSIAGVISGIKAGVDVLLYTGATHHVENLAYKKNILASAKKMETNKLKGVIEDLSQIYDYL